MISKIFLLAILIFSNLVFISNSFSANDPVETIFYNISPFGTSEYVDFGLVDLNGKKANFVTFKTSLFGFDDLERIYSDPEDNLPLRVERDITFLFSKEYIVENYYSQVGKLLIEKFKEGKLVEEFSFQAQGPIHNAIILPFSLRKVPDLDIGWNFVLRLPDEFKVNLVSIEEVRVPAGTFKAFHFTSVPEKFEIWITNDVERIPVKIKGTGGLGYTLSMTKRIIKK